MKLNQSYIYGMGSGLILAAILFGVSDLIGSSQPTAANLLPSGGLSSSVQSEQTQAPAMASNNQAAQSQQSATAGANAEQVQAPLASSQSAEQAPVTGKAKIEIAEGMNARQIANLLVEKGVITDADAFLSTAGSRVSSIRVGSYELPLKADHQQVLTVITKG